MGLGGAFLSLNRQHMAGEAIQHQRRRQTAFSAIQGYLNLPHLLQGFRRLADGPSSWNDLFDGNSGGTDMLEELSFMDALAEGRLDSHRDPWLSNTDGPFAEHFLSTVPQYRVAYTHPYPPADGFAQDFSPSAQNASSKEVIVLDDDAGTSSGASSSISAGSDILACPGCLDPLVLSSDAITQDERSNRRLWGLRCGHMLDGKCVNKLMKPLPPPTLEMDGIELRNATEAGIQGKDDLELRFSRSVADHPSSAPLRQDQTNTQEKGKGKASQLPPGVLEEGTSSLAGIDGNSMRARLRPRRPTSHQTNITSSPIPMSRRSRARARMHPYRPSSAMLTYGPSGSSAHHSMKGKQKVDVPRIIAEYEWQCPVAGCGHPHVSLHIEGRGWVPHDIVGAIAVYV